MQKTARTMRRPLVGRRMAPYLFLLPNMFIFGTFIIWPAINGFNISFYDSQNGRTFEPVGLSNYERILSDELFSQVATNTVFFVFFFVLLNTSLSIFLAVILNAQKTLKSFFRAVVFLPVLLSPVIVGLLWGWLLQRKSGAVNGALLSLFGVEEGPGWLIDPQLSMGVVIFVGVWTNVGFYTLIALAGLQGIDPNVYEAARIDGAGIIQVFRNITLPLLAPTILVVIILAMITGFQAYDYIYSLTGGGPFGASTLIIQYIYESAFQPPIRYGLGSAAGVLLFLTIMTATLINFLIGRRQGNV